MTEYTKKTQAAHTPGPWHVDDRDEDGTHTAELHVRAADDSLIAQLVDYEGYTLPNAEADGCLIAAAPRLKEVNEALLAACLEIQYDYHLLRHHTTKDKRLCFEEYCPSVNAAIALARGGAS